MAHRSGTMGLLERFARRATEWAGSSPAFALAVLTILVWGITGPLFGYSDTWQLVINTGTTIVTFLMVFLIQRSQNKDCARGPPEAQRAGGGRARGEQPADQRRGPQRARGRAAAASLRPAGGAVQAGRGPDGVALGGGGRATGTGGSGRRRRRRRAEGIASIHRLGRGDGAARRGVAAVDDHAGGAGGRPGELISRNLRGFSV